MSVRGALRTMGAGDLFEWIDRRGRAGTLTLERAQTSRKFQVTGGAITSASSTDPCEYLGQLLINAGLIDEEKLGEVYRQQAATGVSLGKLLVTSEAISEKALHEALELKIREGVYDALSWDDGTFVFEPDDGSPRGLEFHVRVPIRPLIAEGIERAAEWRTIRKVIPRDDVRFYLVDRSWLERIRPSSPTAQLLGDVTSGKTVREMTLERHSLPFPIYHRLAELVARGIISVDRRATPRNDEADKGNAAMLVEAAKGRTKGGDHRGALDLARMALELAPADQSIKQVHDELERRVFAALSRSLLTQYRVPKLKMSTDELRSMALSAEERYLVGRIDGRWDLLSLMRVSPLREVEALITFQKLAERGVISLE
ncbi:MAG: DUF4388 domain-containing protein [Deltaproteobacteria bacterium]|nr:DUF4388 domain-containing protein [Deltaproteobacteria bacterium]